jgi:23S rRNA pseudouridine1911/1915/1917 synthase
MSQPPLEACPSDELVDEDAGGPQVSLAEPDGVVELRAATVGTGWHGWRLDKALVALAPEFSRSHLQALVHGGALRIDGRPESTPSRRLRAGQQLQLELRPTAESLAYVPQAMALDVLYEDELVLVVNKPVGLVVHPGAGNWSGTLLNGLLAHHPGAAALPRAGIVHRLDKDTSGAMVVAKTLPAVTALVREIAARRVQRRYLAIAHGSWRLGEQTLEAPIGRDPVSRVRMAVVAVAAGGRAARTDVRPVASTADHSALVCRLHTGRTHQIRVHLAHAGHPLVGDATYGGAPALGMRRQALHAMVLAFEHPGAGSTLTLRAPPPADFATAWGQMTGVDPAIAADA